MRALASLAGVNYVSLARIEAGRLDPRVSTLKQLAWALDISIADLFPTQSNSKPKQKEVPMGKWSVALKSEQQKRDEKVASASRALREWRRKHLLKGVGEVIWDYEWEQLEAACKLLEKIVGNLKGPDNRKKE